MAAYPINLAANEHLIVDDIFRFLDLPGEVRNKVYEYLFEYGRAINVTMPKRYKYGRVPNHFKYYFPGISGTPLLRGRKEVNTECMSFMWGSNKFSSDNALTVNALPQAMGEGIKHIRQLSLLTHFRWIVYHNECWPRAQKFLVENLPALQEFELRTRFPENQPPLIEASGNSRVRQELRDLARFQAFFTVRKPDLDLLVLTERRVIGGRVHLSVKVMNKRWKLEASDTLLDSRAIRRHTWDELHNLSMRRFEIEKTNATSETAEFDVLPADAANIDNWGYKTKGELMSMCVKKWPMVDTLIRRARDNMKEAKRLDDERAEGERKAEMDLLAIAQAPRKNNKKGRRGWAKVQL